ncbi:integrase [Stigmatella aurantiaca]|uniref:integrase n=1 Tax=Stigmatella aurantiaca TaxID=41 RepID=UPI0002FE5D5F|nr:integrase [Stigmatella aurantiaca]
MIDLPLVEKFLEHLKREGRTERHRKNVRNYLAQWAAIKSFFSWLREEEATLTTAEDLTLALKVPPARPEKAMRDKGYSMHDVERFYTAIAGWESKKYSRKGTGRVTVDPEVGEAACLAEGLLGRQAQHPPERGVDELLRRRVGRAQYTQEGHEVLLPTVPGRQDDAPAGTRVDGPPLRAVGILS